MPNSKHVINPYPSTVTSGQKDEDGAGGDARTSRSVHPLAGALDGLLAVLGRVELALISHESKTKQAKIYITLKYD